MISKEEYESHLDEIARIEAKLRPLSSADQQRSAELNGEANQYEVANNLPPRGVDFGRWYEEGDGDDDGDPIIYDPPIV